MPAQPETGTHNVLLYCCNESSSDSILCSLFGLYIPFCNHPVIKVQIVLPCLLSIPMAWWECGVFLKALIFEVIVPLCLQGAAQVVLFFFHFPDMFRISGKLPPVLLTAICLAWLHDKCSCSASWCRLCFGLKSRHWGQQWGWVSDEISCYSFVIVGSIKSCAIDLPSTTKWNSVFVVWLKKIYTPKKIKSFKCLLLFLILLFLYVICSRYLFPEL